MSVFGVVGKPILHSKSPDLMRVYFASAGIEGYYTRIALDDIDELRKFFVLLKLKGVNVTSPFKEAAFSFVDEVDEIARMAGAVNTILRNKDGTFFGCNTDFDGVRYVFGKYNIGIRGKKAVVVGLGGAGKTCAQVLKSMGAKVTVVNRTFEKAREFAGRMGCSYSSVEGLEKVVRNSDIVVSALPQGISLIDRGWLQAGQVLMDANYRNSVFRGVDKEIGCVVLDSFHWLIGQSVPAFEIFTGERVELERIDFSSIFEERNFDTIAIIGFMLSGKSAVGRLLAEKLGWEFVDIDCLIERKTGKRIKEIFESDGEDRFREIENQVFLEVVGKGRVLSCGGGIVLRKENREVLRNRCLNVWILSSVEEALKRMRDDARPLLNVGNPVERALEIFEKRIEFYADVSDLVILNEGKSLREVAGRLYEEVNSVIGN